MSNNYKKIYKIILVSILSALGFILMLVEIPTFTSWLKFDISDTIVVFASTVLGPFYAIIVAFLKSLLHYLLKGSPVGIPLDQIIAFVSSVVYMIPFYYVYKRSKNVWLSVVTGVVSLTIILPYLNYLYFTPLYLELLGAELPDNFLKFIVVTYIPFNLLKSITISIIYVVIHKRILPLYRSNIENKL